MPTSSNERAPQPRDVPGRLGPPVLGVLLQTGAFMRDWFGFLDARRREHGATVFRMGLGMPLVAAIDLESIDHLADPADFERLYGFGPRRPLPWVLDGHVPVVFRNDASHAALKRLHLAVYASRADALPAVLDDEIEQAFAQWCAQPDLDAAAALDVLVARVLYRWLLDDLPPRAPFESVGRGVIPLRLHDRRRRDDAAVRAAFLELAAHIEGRPGFAAHAELAKAHGIAPRELARDLAFTLPMNAWGAVSGTILSSLVELDLHPVHREEVARDAGARARFVAEVTRLHPAAPVTFGRARRDLELRSSTGTFRVRAGETVLGVLAMAHRDPRYFPDPATFRPERFRDGATLSRLRWGAADPTVEAGADTRACPGGRDAMRIVGRVLGRLAEARWSLAEPVEWGTRLMPRNVPESRVVLHAFWRQAPPPGLALQPRPESAGDRRKVGALDSLRRMQLRSVESWSRSTFRTRRAAGEPPAIVPAAEHYATPEIPRSMVVPAELPAQGRMGPTYTLPYYVAAGVYFMYLGRSPLDGLAAWTLRHPWLARFEYPSPWGNLQDDATFVALRTAGPNPFLLRAVGDDAWEVDYGPIFAGVTEPISCRFHVRDGRLGAESIEVDGTTVRPGEPGWRRAAVLANAVDARAAIFVQHLGLTHLVVGQALALSRFSLPPAHPLRPLLDLHCFATLEVNDWAYKLLVSPTSYFIRSGFLSRAAAFRMFTNVAGEAGIDHLFPDRDVPARGIDRVPGHAYAEEAPAAFASLRRYVAAIVEPAFPDDAAVAADEALARWHTSLRALLPRMPADFGRLDGRAGLVELLTALVYNNVAHEVVGDFSPYFAADDEESAGLVDLRRLVDRLDGPPSLRAVFLMKQGAWSARFQLQGNCIVEVDPREVTDSPPLQAALAELQRDLRARSVEVRARNERRAHPIRGMDPATWKLSIGI